MPSGLSAQTGAAAADAVRADATVTMIVPKPGLLTPAGAAYCGTVRVAPLAHIEPLMRSGTVSGMLQEGSEPVNSVTERGCQGTVVGNEQEGDTAISLDVSKQP